MKEPKGNAMRTTMPSAWRSSGLAAILIVWLLALVACAPVRFVADYDAEATKAITDTSADVLAFYDRMIGDALSTKGPVRLPYDKYKDGWSKIETQLRVMVVREESGCPSWDNPSRQPL